jgi:anti-sigma factor RsiW
VKKIFMSDDQLLEIMAYADGELAANRKVGVEQLLSSNPSAAALHRELAGIRTLVRSNEPTGQIADTREFYWSQIQRRIAAEESAANHKSPARSSPLNWLRWLVPALGVAAVALIAVFQPRPVAAVIAGSEASAMTFTSDSDGVTIRWIN